VPTALVGSPAGEIFHRLVRMNDGARHDAMKPVVAHALEHLDAAQIAVVSRARARALADAIAPHEDRQRLAEFALRLTAETVATLLGVAPDAAPTVATWAAEFVACLAPGASLDQLERGKAAAGHLLAAGGTLTSGSGLVAALARDAQGDVDAAIANALGFLSQSYEATAGLIGNTLVALARHADLRRAVSSVVLEVVRHDAPVQNTRRFVVDDGDVAGVRMRAGDAILVVLAAANRDPAVNADPDELDVTRTAPAVFTFGLGAHACPGAMLAATIASAGVQQLIGAGLAFDGLLDGLRYRPSANTRIPLFAAR